MAADRTLSDIRDQILEAHRDAQFLIDTDSVNHRGPAGRTLTHLRKSLTDALYALNTVIQALDETPTPAEKE